MAMNLERALAGSDAVIARSLAECHRLANSDKQGYATYYQLIESESRLPDGDGWDALRRVVDEALFPGYKEKIRFGALSLNGVGLQRYGDCSLMLRPELIDFRSTVFTENSVLHMKRHAVPITAIPNRVVGHRAPWVDRARLALAKLSDKLDKATPGNHFPGLLLEQGAGPEDDAFVEVHIWGPVSIRTVKRVTFTGARKLMSKVIAKALREKLAAHGAELRGWA